MPKQQIKLEDLYALRPKAIWQAFWGENFSFWMICGYLFVEYVRPQSIVPALDFLPWASLFLLLAFVGAVLDPSVKWTKTPANKWMILFLVIILLSCWNAVDSEVSYQNLDRIYTWIVIYFLIVHIVNSPQRMFLFLGIFTIASFKISLSLAITWAKRGFSFTNWGLMGPPGFFQNSGELAIQMCVFFPVAFLLAAQLRPYVSKAKFFVLALMPVTSVMVVLGASSRGGQLALLLQLVLMFYRQLLRPRILVSLALVGVLAFSILPDEQKQRFSESGSDKTSQQRIYYWKAGIEMLNEHPLLGVGYFNFSSYFERYYPDWMLYPYAELPHNIFIQVGVDAGYIGLFVYLMLLKSGFYRQPSPQSGPSIFALGIWPGFTWALHISFIGFLVAGQFVSVVYYPFMWIHLALISSWRSIFSTAIVERS